jgi:hypothetical protein
MKNRTKNGKTKSVILRVANGSMIDIKRSSGTLRTLYTMQSTRTAATAFSRSHPKWPRPFLFWDCSLFTFYNLPCPYKFTFRPLFYLFWQDKVICHKVLRLPCLPCTVIQLYLGKWRCSRYRTLVSLITSWRASTQARDHVHSTAYSLRSGLL